MNSIQLNLKHDLVNLNKWVISNKLTLNTAKTEFILIISGSRQKLSILSSPPELSIDYVLIEQVTSVKSLGISLLMKSTVANAHRSKRIASGIEAIKGVRDFVPTPTLHCI